MAQTLTIPMELIPPMQYHEADEACRSKRPTKATKASKSAPINFSTETPPLGSTTATTTSSSMPALSQRNSFIVGGGRAASSDLPETASISSHSFGGTGGYGPCDGGCGLGGGEGGEMISLCGDNLQLTFSWRRLALCLSLYANLAITLAKLVTYIQTLSLSVLAALLDSVLDVVSQLVLSYTERHSTMQRSSALYPAGASRLEPIGVLTCAALMGMASFEVLKESFTTIFYRNSKAADEGEQSMRSFWAMASIVVVKLLLLQLCKHAANRKVTHPPISVSHQSTTSSIRVPLELNDPTLGALAQDHLNDCLSNSVAAVALLFTLRMPALWFLDPVGAILISFYIIRSWYTTGQEQIEHLTGKAAPQEFLDDLLEIANNFDERMKVDCLRAYHFGPKFLVELEMVMPKETVLFESHDLGMELQYEIEALEEVDRCFVHIDYETRPYDEHVVSKVPELRAKYGLSKSKMRSSSSV